jgi:ABC-type branched-subunit amino acid transport system ATPase component
MIDAAAEPVLTVEHLSMRFGGLVAVDDLSFTARRRDITALIGPNGAGKTTVFNCITGFYKPSVGMIRLTHVDGKTYLLERLFDFRISKLARVARTFQNIRLFAGMTALENLLVAQHNPLMRASGMTFLGMLGFATFTTSIASASSIAPTMQPAHCPMAPSAGSRSPAPCAPTQCCCVSTSPPLASTRTRAMSSTNFCSSSAPNRACRSY